MIRRPDSFRRAARALGLAGLLAAAGGPASAGVQLGILPGTTNVSPGAEFDVTVDVTAAGSPFNAFRVLVTYDTTALTFVPAAPLSAQQGCLMTGLCSGACGTTFHQFDAAHDSVAAYTSLMCSGVSLTGPGTIYKLRFRASATPGVTQIRLAKALFYDGGLWVTPVATADARVGIGVELGVGDGPAPARGLRVTPEPNPAHGPLVFAIESDRAGASRVEVFDLSGRLVRRFDEAWREPGRARLAWDGADASGTRVRPGVYLVRVRAGDRVARARFAILD